MKTFFVLVVCSFLCAASFAQTRYQAVSSTNTATNNFYKAAGETGTNIGLLLPAVQKVREAARHPRAKRYYTQLESLLKNAKRLSASVQRTRGRMSQRQYQVFQRQLATYDYQLNKLAGQAPHTAGDPKPGTMGECFQSCDDAYGSGFGGGKGWNRFWCKAGCIASQSVPGN